MKKDSNEDMMRDYMEMQRQSTLKRYRILNEAVVKGEILFTGSSLMEQFPLNELMMTCGIRRIAYNRGIGGFTTEDMLAHMEEMVFGTEPSEIFINIGTNDIAAPGYQLEQLLGQYEKIIDQILERLPEVRIYMMAYYPVNDSEEFAAKAWSSDLFLTRNNKNINTANEAIEKLAAKKGCRYIDVNNGLRDENGRLKAEFTVEGIHMYANGYRVVLENLKPYLERK